MLSVVLYGRNDSHGYNLHKRASLSLNCLAETLTDPDDELIFVDYNTPDELPTFPEAIADTLTDRCKQVLRVLRVRPWLHAQYASRTRLVALESQSRNIAVRRSNPANRWVLSTNTDMIFCTEDPKASLSTTVADLKDGFYHLPRYEVPEGFWERMDRMDPKAAIAGMREYGRRFHIDEVVYGSYDNLFEGPGDFQLFLRQDLFDVFGFEEEMILGWHVDSNIARRMKMLRGEVTWLKAGLSGYHCGHTRQATSLHGGDRTENDFETFVRDLKGPKAEHQAETWGAPGAEIEEVRLTRKDRYFEGLSAAIPAAAASVYEVAYSEQTYGKVTYDAAHVLPHLCDLIFNLPPAQTILFFGDDIALLEGVRAFADGAGRGDRFLVAELADAAKLAKTDPGRWGEAVTATGEGLAQADLILVQYPSYGALPDAEREQQEWLCQRLMAAAAQPRGPGAKRPRVAVVNGIHNGLSSIVEFALAPTVMPFSARLRQGFVRDDGVGASAARTSAAAPVYGKLGRLSPFTPQDRTLLRRVIASLLSGQPTAGWERLAPEIAAVASAPPAVRMDFGVESEADAIALDEQADAAMRRQIGRLVQAPEALGPRIDTLNRLCSGADWDDPAWARLAVIYFGMDVTSFRERKRWMWERISILRAVQAQLPIDPLSPDPAQRTRKLLFCADSPDLLGALLCNLGYDVTYATSAELKDGKAEGGWREALAFSGLSLPPPFRPLEPGTGEFEAFVVTLPALFERGAAEADAVLAAAHRFMKPGALLIASATTQLNEIAYEGAFGFAEWKALYTPEGPMGSRGFEPVGGFDDRVAMDTAVRFAFNDDPQETVPGLSCGFLKGFNTCALLTARWPAELKMGPQGRIEWPDQPLVNPYKVAIPYGRQPLRPTPDDYYAEAAGFDLNAQAMRAFTDALPVTADATARNLRPFLAVFTGETERGPLATTVTEEGGARVCLCLEVGDARQVRVRVEAGEAKAVAAAAVVQGWGLVPARVEDGEVIVERDHALNRVTVAVLLSPSPAVIRRVEAVAVSATREAAE